MIIIWLGAESSSCVKYEYVNVLSFRHQFQEQTFFLSFLVHVCSILTFEVVFLKAYVT